MKPEVKVYVMNVNEMFMAGGENVGKTYSLEEFEEKFNDERINPEVDIIKFVYETNNKRKQA